MKFYPALDIKTSGSFSPEMETGVVISGEMTTTVVDLALAELDAHGPIAVEEIPDGIRVFFSTSTLRNDAMRTAGTLRGVIVTSVDVADEDWAARSQASLTPITIDDICVTPPWAIDAARSSGAKHVIVIQPSMGFGTGHHASTRLCLRWLQQIPIAGARVVDVGTGSGVLAIAAERLGAQTVVGVDIDDDALESARGNLDLNGGGQAIELRAADLEGTAESGERFDVVIANLTGGLLIRTAAVLANLAMPHARLVASGFETHETSEVVTALEAAGWRQAGILDESGWAGLSMTQGS